MIKNNETFEEKYINFVLAGDAHYIIPMSVTMTSILCNLSKNIKARFFILNNGFSRSKFRKVCELEKKYNCVIINIPVNKYLHYFGHVNVKNSKLSDYISIATFYRLLIPKVLPSNIEKCIYIDSDIIVNTDLLEIYDKHQSDKLISVVVEIIAMQFKDSILLNHKKIPAFEKLFLSPNENPYFNAGFFILNLNLARKLKIFSQFIEVIKKGFNFDYVDQDILNLTIGQRYQYLINYLDPSYNVFCQPALNIDYNGTVYYDKELIKEAVNHPKIYHFGGSNKPWINKKITNYYEKW